MISSPSRIWLAWVAANVLPSLVVSALLLGIRDTLGTDRAVVVAYVVLFALVAAMQAAVCARWRAARGGGTARGRWVGWTLGGLVVGMFFGVGTLATLDGLGHEWLGLVAGWAIGGLVLGVMQAVALGVSKRASAWWVGATVAGWVAAAAVWEPLARSGASLVRSTPVHWLVGGLAVDGNVELAITAVTLALYGALTGGVLARLTPAPVVNR